MAIKKYGRTVNIFDDTNIIEIPNAGDRYGVIVPSGTYSIYNGTDNIVYYGRDNWTARSPACQPHTTATITLNVGSGGGFFMPYNSASQGGCTIVVGETPPDHYIPYRDWLVHGYKKYGTETETFNTLPKEIIGDGTAISAWSLKGNMSQSGTPTPSTPVYPTEVGEKTANLWDGVIYNSSIRVDYPWEFPFSSGGNRSTFFAEVQPNRQYTISFGAMPDRLVIVGYYSKFNHTHFTFC